MTRLKLYAFDGTVWLKEELSSVSVDREAFKQKIRACCSMTSSLPCPSVVELLCLVHCHLVDQNNMRESKHAMLSGEELN